MRSMHPQNNCIQEEKMNRPRLHHKLCTPSSIGAPAHGPPLHCIHRRARTQDLVAIAQPGDLQEGVGAVAFEAVHLQTAGPVFGVDAAHG
nr:hypothetical protein CFP56_29949 [Quercus suber]